MKTTLKIILTGFIVTLFRIGGQLLIPAGAAQTVLSPSVFVQNGTLPLYLTLYSILGYSLIASIYLLMNIPISGKRWARGLKFGAACAALWVVYLQEPLPHASFADRFTYPVVDGIALLMMGLVLGLLFPREKGLGEGAVADDQRKAALPEWVVVWVIAGCFFIGRWIQYSWIHIYSSFETQPTGTLVWAGAAGIVTALVCLWFGKHVFAKNRTLRALRIGLLFFGVNLLVFNFFMPLIFTVDLLDLALRTGIDVAAIVVGVWLTGA